MAALHYMRYGGLMSAALILALAYFFCHRDKLNDGTKVSVFDVSSVLMGLLAAEAEAVVRPGARVLIGFGGCLDRLGNSLAVLDQLQAAAPDVAENVNELHNIEDLRKAFAYYFSNGASAGRSTKNHTFFAEVEHAFMSLPNTRTAVGGNAPVMAKRFHTEGVNVILAARMSKTLRQQLDPAVTVIGDPIDEQDTHLILEYEKGDSWGPYTASRANRFIVYNSVGSRPFVSLLQDFSSEVIRLQPSVLVVGGLRLLLSADSDQERVVNQLSKMLLDVAPSTRIHIELSSFPDPAQLSLIIDNIVRHADSIGLNEQELPVLSRLLQGNRRASSSENSHPSVRTTLSHALSVFRSLRSGHRRFSRIHVHTLAFQLIIVEVNGLWPNGRSAVAKAALTANRHTCGSHSIDVHRAKLLLESIVEISDTEHLQLDGAHSAICWTKTFAESDTLTVEICLAPVLVCTNVKQTVGGGDNVSAAGLVLQI